MNSFPQATEHYLDVVLDAVGSDKYRRLFDLYQGSALSIVIDTTSSMSGEINAVTDQVAEIVANIPTELYILVPFNDPGKCFFGEEVFSVLGSLLCKGLVPFHFTRQPSFSLWISDVKKTYLKQFTDSLYTDYLLILFFFFRRNHRGLSSFSLLYFYTSLLLFLTL